MNIFVLHEHPGIAAEMLCDSHVVKMCLESAQLLTGAAILRGVKKPYSWPKYHNIKHPVLLSLDSEAKVNWLLLHFRALLDEYEFRFSKTHSYNREEYRYVQRLWQGTESTCHGLAKCCGDLDVADLDIVTAYRKYYTEIKKPQLMEKNRWNFTKRKDWTNEP